MIKINKIACSKCKKSKSVRPDVLEKRIKVYGSLEKLLAEYECRTCRKAPGSKAPKSKKSRTSEGLNADGQYFWQVPGFKYTTPAPVYPTETQSDYKRAYGTSCAKPNLFLDNNRFCDGCVFLVTCACPLKRTRADGGMKIDSETGETKKLTYYMRKKLGLLKHKRK